VPAAGEPAGELLKAGAGVEIGERAGKVVGVRLKK
jgi:hypothetical protein